MNGSLHRRRGCVGDLRRLVRQAASHPEGIADGDVIPVGVGHHFAHARASDQLDRATAPRGGVCRLAPLIWTGMLAGRCVGSLFLAPDNHARVILRSPASAVGVGGSIPRVAPAKKAMSLETAVGAERSIPQVAPARIAMSLETAVGAGGSIPRVAPARIAKSLETAVGAERSIPQVALHSVFNLDLGP